MLPIPWPVRLRAAGRIHDEYARRSGDRPLPLLPVPDWEECVRLERLIRKAQAHRLTAAAARLRPRLAARLEALGQCCHDMAEAVRRSNAQAPVPGLPLLLEELAALADEFPAAEIDTRNGELAVTTEPVVLEGRDLGPFSIRLEWSGLGRSGSSPYRVVALQPQPAGSDSETTHPHVQDERLCEGDGRTAIRAALAAGRLCDFFLVVAQTLQTYNDGSAYVSLDEWDGARCSECDDAIPSGEGSSCERCQTECCSECCRYCEECERTCCSACSDRCTECGEAFCNRCLIRCTDCRDLFCHGCLPDGLCSGCQPEAEPEPDTHPTSDLEISHADQTIPPPVAAAPAAQ